MKTVLITPKGIDRNSISIKITEGISWKITFYPLVTKGAITPVVFPGERGIYTLIINYGRELYYREIFIYRQSPKNEELCFSFYTEGTRIFCRITSYHATELNKEVVLNPLPDDMKAALDELDKLE